MTPLAFDGSFRLFDQTIDQPEAAWLLSTQAGAGRLVVLVGRCAARAEIRPVAAPEPLSGAFRVDARAEERRVDAGQCRAYCRCRCLEFRWEPAVHEITHLVQS